MSDDGSRIRVIGVGSPFGDDALGLEAARRLARQARPRVEVVAADRPGERLLDLFAGCEAVIVIDAAQRAGKHPRDRAGTVHDMELAGVGEDGSRQLSSHGLGIAQAIALAGALGRLPPRGRLLAVEIEPGAGGDERLSPSAEAALEEVRARTEHWIAVYLGVERG